MRVGFVRCSTAEQNEARQLKMMEEQKVEKVFIDKASGKNVDRKDFKTMMAFVRAGDTVIVESISTLDSRIRIISFFPILSHFAYSGRFNLGTHATFFLYISWYIYSISIYHRTFKCCHRAFAYYRFHPYIRPPISP